MAGGINISQGAAAVLGNTASLAIVTITEGGNLNSLLGTLGISNIANPFGPYRDKQQNKSAVYSIVVPAANNTQAINQNTGQQIESGNTYTLQGTGVSETPTPSKQYVFDAVLVANHISELEPTRHPLQTGANISDHAILRQPLVTLEIGMSDAMAEFTVGMWSTTASKSISAWQVLKQLQADRTLITLSTRQQTYQNMLIRSISSPETAETFAGMRATVTFEQMLIVDAVSITLTSRPQATDQTPLASLQSGPVDSTVTQQHEVTNLPLGNNNSAVNQYGVPYGGQFSSNNIAG